MSMKDEFVSDYTFMDMNCTQELQLFGDHGIITSYWEKK